MLRARAYDATQKIHEYSTAVESDVNGQAFFQQPVFWHQQRMYPQHQQLYTPTNPAIPPASIVCTPLSLSQSEKKPRGQSKATTSPHQKFASKRKNVLRHALIQRVGYSLIAHCLRSMDV